MKESHNEVKKNFQCLFGSTMTLLIYLGQYLIFLKKILFEDVKPKSSYNVCSNSSDNQSKYHLI